MSFRDFPLQYDMSGGSVKISLSCLWAKPGGNIIGKGQYYCKASLIFCDDFLSLNLTSERCFSTTLVGHSESVSRSFSYFPQKP